VSKSEFDQLCFDWTIALGVYLVEAARTSGLISTMELQKSSSRQREMLSVQKLIETEAYARLMIARRLMYVALDSVPDLNPA
jgi:hypothetical protein